MCCQKQYPLRDEKYMKHAPIKCATKKCKSSTLVEKMIFRGLDEVKLKTKDEMEFFDDAIDKKIMK